MRVLVATLAAVVAACPGYAEVYHVSSTGLDGNPGTEEEPFKTISAAVSVAGPGDTITVHEGVYRERINPPRGGSSDEKRIVYQAAKGDEVLIKGSEIVKGWIIEDNTIRYSVSTCVTLGKYGDEFDNTSANAAVGYVETIERGLANGWSKENIGHHVVRNNHISHCEQAGIVGSLGPIFSTVTGNTIHDIHVRRLFGGHEMAGIKFHGAVDTLISNNHIYRTVRGIWLDWMSQGTRVTGNLLHDNGPLEDIFVEVNHGPFVVDNNVLLSPISLLVNSQGCAYAHNLITGRVRVETGEGRMTPYLEEHGTGIVALANNPGGDDRYFNNLIVNGGLAEYDPVKLPMFLGGNVYLNGAQPSKHESDPLVLRNGDPGVKLVEQEDGLYLQVDHDEVWKEQERRLVTTESLGRAKTPDLPYLNYDAATLEIDRDYFGNERKTENPYPGPFIEPKEARQSIKVWPKKAPICGSFN